MTPHSPVRQPTMDNGEAKTRENQGEMPLSEISDHELVELAQHRSLRGQATWIPHQANSTVQEKHAVSETSPTTQNTAAMTSSLSRPTMHIHSLCTTQAYPIQRLQLTWGNI